MNKSTIIALVTAALAATTALSTAAEARGFGGGGFRGFGGGGMRSAPMRSFKAAPSFKAFKAKPASSVMKSVKSKPSFVKREFKPSRAIKQKSTASTTQKSFKRIKPESKVAKHVKPAPKLTKMNKFTKITKTAKHTVKPNQGKALKQIKMAKQLKLLKKGPQAKPMLAKLKTNKLFGHKLAANKMLGNKMLGNKLLGNKLALKGAKPMFTKLNPVMKQKAMHFDFMGKKYSPMKKAWWDGKHWWFGAAALSWVFVDGYWYYGDEHVYWEDDAWRTESGFVAECLDCSTEYVTRTRVATVGTAASDDTPSQPVTRTVTRTTSADDEAPSKSPAKRTSAPAKDADKQVKPLKSAGNDTDTKTTTPMSTEAVLIRSNTAELAEPTGELPSVAEAPAGDTTTGTAAVAEPTQVAEVAVDPAATNDAGVPAATETEPAASPVIDCKRFVPAVGMTVSVPCGM